MHIGNYLVMKRAHTGVKVAGTGGGSFDVATWNKAARLSVYSLQGGFPVAISITVAPKDQISEAKEQPDCLITSGAIQGTDPFRANILASNEAEHNEPTNCFEHPKSANLAIPLSVTRILAPLISR